MIKRWVGIAWLCVTFAVNASARDAEPNPPVYGQVLFGSLQLNDRDVTIENANEKLTGEMPDQLPYLGAAAQLILRDELIGYGWEGGGFFSWYNKDVSYFASGGGDGGTLQITIDNQFFSFETFMGAYVSFKPWQGLRFYLSGGPLFLFAAARSDDPETEDTDINLDSGSGSAIYIDANQWHTDFTVGCYVRAGFDIYLANGFWVGFSSRYMEANVDLSSAIGEFQIDGTLHFLALTRRY